MESNESYDQRYIKRSSLVHNQLPFPWPLLWIVKSRLIIDGLINSDRSSHSISMGCQYHYTSSTVDYFIYDILPSGSHYSSPKQAFQPTRPSSSCASASVNYCRVTINGQDPLLRDSARTSVESPRGTAARAVCYHMCIHETYTLYN